MVVAAAIAVGAAGSGSGGLWSALGAAVAAAVVVMLYSALQARSGRWAHIDASQPHERWWWHGRGSHCAGTMCPSWSWAP